MSDKSAESASAEAPKAEGAAHGGGAKGGSGGGAGSWLPLIITLVAMPALAFAATKFMIIPQIQKAVAEASGSHGEAGEDHGKEAEAAGGHGAAPAAGGHGAPAASGGHGGGAEGKEKPQFVLNKLIVNVAGTMGTRLLMSSITLVGAKTDFKAKAEEHVDQLKDLAGTALANKTIAEIEKPGFRNQIRSELITVFNEALGEGAVREVYLTEFAIQ